MRPVTMRIPSMVIMLTLWEATEDEESFPVKGLKTKSPYVKAYGKKYPLTKQEVKHARELSRVFSDWKEPKL